MSDDTKLDVILLCEECVRINTALGQFDARKKRIEITPDQLESITQYLERLYEEFPHNQALLDFITDLEAKLPKPTECATT